MEYESLTNRIESFFSSKTENVDFTVLWVVLPGTDEKDFFDKLGRELIQTSSQGCVEKAFRCLGGDLTEFLTTLDGVHDVLKYQENSQGQDEHENEAFICTSNDDGLRLDFSTDRTAIAYLLVGSLKEIAAMLYDTETDIEFVRSSRDERTYR